MTTLEELLRQISQIRQCVQTEPRSLSPSRSYWLQQALRLDATARPSS